MECIFCKIVEGTIPAAKVYEDETLLAFLDINPANKGHTLVIPKEHYATFLEIPGGILERLGPVVQKIAKKIIEETKAEGFNLLMNNHKVAGQEIPHAHIHIIPRKSDDGIKISLPHGNYEEGEIQALAEQLKVRDEITEGLEEAKKLEENTLLSEEEIKELENNLEEEKEQLQTILDEENAEKNP